MNGKLGNRQARLAKNAKLGAAAQAKIEAVAQAKLEAAAQNTTPERPPQTIHQLVTFHDVQLYKLSRLYSMLIERMDTYDKRLENLEESELTNPTFEEDVSTDEAQLQMVVEKS